MVADGKESMGSATGVVDTITALMGSDSMVIVPIDKLAAILAGDQRKEDIAPPSETTAPVVGTNKSTPPVSPATPENVTPSAVNPAPPAPPATPSAPAVPEPPSPQNAAKQEDKQETPQLLDDLRGAIKKLVMIDPDKAISIVESHGANQVSQLAQEQWPEVLKEINQAILDAP